MEKISYKLQVFEGPLDLLLSLIQKNKLNIFDIPIAELLDQYMEAVRRMQEENLDVASEFLEMAARLVHLKSLSLLPRKEEEEELKRELVGELLEYQQCREAALCFAQQFTFSRMVRPPAEFPREKGYRGKIDGQELLDAYLAVKGRKKSRLPEPEAFSGIVHHRIVSVSSQIIAVLRRLWKQPKVAYKRFFLEKQDKSECVAAFLALLELIRGKRVRMEGEGEETVIQLVKKEREP